MPYRLTDFSKSEKENVKVLMRNLDEMEELGEEWLFRNVEMPPGATPNTADIAFFKHRDRYCIEARPQVTYHGDIGFILKRVACMTRKLAVRSMEC